MEMKMEMEMEMMEMGHEKEERMDRGMGGWRDRQQDTWRERRTQEMRGEMAVGCWRGGWRDHPQPQPPL